MTVHSVDLWSECEHTQGHRLHIWQVFQHDPAWRLFRCFCSRCGNKCSTTSAELERQQNARDAYWLKLKVRKKG